MVGLDAGGTRTRAVLATADDGRPVGEGAAGPGNALTVPVPQLTEHLAEAVGRAVPEAVRDRVVAVAGGFAGATGAAADEPGRRNALAALTVALRRLGIDAGPPVIGSDIEAAFASAPGTPADGLALVAGTGAVAMRITGRRGTVTVDGDGWLLGDDGSGFWIGRAAVRAALRMADGRGAPTVLAETVGREFGVPGDALPGGAAAGGAVRRLSPDVVPGGAEGASGDGRHEVAPPVTGPGESGGAGGAGAGRRESAGSGRFGGAGASGGRSAGPEQSGAGGWPAGPGQSGGGGRGPGGPEQSGEAGDAGGRPSGPEQSGAGGRSAGSGQSGGVGAVGGREPGGPEQSAGAGVAGGRPSGPEQTGAGGRPSGPESSGGVGAAGGRGPAGPGESGRAGAVIGGVAGSPAVGRRPLPPHDDTPWSRPHREAYRRHLLPAVMAEPPIRLARLAPLVVAAARDAEDPVALAILDEAADQLTETVRALSPDPGERVVVTGGLLGPDGPLTDRLETRLRALGLTLDWVPDGCRGAVALARLAHGGRT
ncbi:BadF/BadG/BcrA/BcrD ATPase family protein [Streptomyces coeruleorubidus]|uniref:BadF/BadG/BcrA/BcrD ATPase family protein n=1 Tax=Streptomyces coeruleorubidus TaxID=116188 RepID=UPI0037B874FA